MDYLLTRRLGRIQAIAEGMLTYSSGWIHNLGMNLMCVTQHSSSQGHLS